MAGPRPGSRQLRGYVQRMTVIFGGLLATVLAWLFTAFALDAYGKRKLPSDTHDAIIVPGCAVRPDGTPSGALRRRTEHAIALWRSGQAPVIVLTGGVGRYPPSEAEAAAKIAERAGVPIDNLLLEKASTTTEENARLSAQLRHGMKAWSVIVVSDGYHCWRCKKLFSRHYAQVVTVGSMPSRKLRIRGALREVASIAKMGLRL